MKSLGKMLETLEGLTGTSDITLWEDKFIINNLRKYRDAGKSTSCLSETVVETIEELYEKHYG